MGLIPVEIGKRVRVRGAGAEDFGKFSPLWLPLLLSEAQSDRIQLVPSTNYYYRQRHLRFT